METQKVEQCASQVRLGQGKLMETSQTRQIHLLHSSWVPDMAHTHTVAHTHNTTA